MASAISGCSGSSSSDFQNIVESVGNKSQSPCTIKSFVPSEKTIKVSAAASATTTFSITTEGEKCGIKYFLNGEEIEDQVEASLNLASAALNEGSNKFKVEISNEFGTSSNEWTVTKNKAPVCAFQTPAPGNQVIAAGTSATFSAVGSDGDADAISFSWFNDGVTVSGSPFFSSTGSGLSSTLTYSPNSSQAGSHVITAQLSDGMDQVACTWPVSVASNCAISNSTPSGANVRVAALGSTTSIFGVTANDPSCTIAWRLNGATLPGSSPFLNLASSSLNSGANTLEAVLANSGSQAIQSWTVTKNGTPQCVAQTPNAAGNVLDFAQTLNLTATVADPNGDPVTFAWSLNNANSALFYPVNSTTVSSATTFHPTASNVANGQSIFATFTDGYDTSSCQWAVDIQQNSACTIQSSFPSSSTLKVPALSTATTLFSITPQGQNCNIVYKLNGNVIAGATDAAYQLASSSLAAGLNTFRVEVSNQYGGNHREWTVTKNTPPVCAFQTPNSTGTLVAAGTSQAFTAVGSDSDGDALSFGWFNDGVNVSASALFSFNTSALSSTATYSPDITQVGAHSLTAQINDGMDSASCTWSTSVANNCAVTNSTPAGASVRVASLGSTPNMFGVTANDNSCAITWRLNGVIQGTTGSFFSINSSGLNSGSNTLEAILTNSGSSVTRTWTVVKNTAPVCASQNPAATGNSIGHTQTMDFTANVTDADGDSVSFAWTLNSANANLFNPINSTASSSTATIDPTPSQVANGQSVVATFTDGYDSSSCQWSLNILDPGGFNIVCDPDPIAVDPVVVTSAGANSAKTLHTNPIGTGLTFKWFRDSVEIGGQTASSLNLTAGGLAVGVYEYKAEVRDSFNSLKTCTWNVKRNAPPAISNPIPINTYNSPTPDWRTRADTAVNLSVTATDVDPITYEWLLDNSSLGAGSSILPNVNTPMNTYDPDSAQLYGTNPHTITVKAKDAYEESSLSWTIEVNGLSDVCNRILNGVPSADASGREVTGGKICTFAGQAGIGANLDVATNQQKIRIQPRYMKMEEDKGMYFSDGLSHAVFFYNTSASTLTRFGVQIPAGQFMPIAGMGAAGRTPDGTSALAFKLSTPNSIAYDAGASPGGGTPTERLWIADSVNNRVVLVSGNGVATTVLGNLTGTQNLVGNSTATGASAAAGTTHMCAAPSGLALDKSGSPHWLYVTCSGSHSIKRLNVSPLHADFGKAEIAIGRVYQNSTTAPANAPLQADGPAGGLGSASVNGPREIEVDENGNIYWIEIGSRRLRMATMSGTGVTDFLPAGGTATAAFALSAFDSTAAGFLTTATAAPNTQVIATGTPTKFGITIAPRIGSTVCAPTLIHTWNATNDPSPVASDTTVNLSITGNEGAFFSDDACANTITSTVITTGNHTKMVYYRRNAADTSITLNATGTLTAGTATPAADTVAAAGRLRVTAPARFAPTDCLPAIVTFENGGGTAAATAGISRTVIMHNNAPGIWYSDSSCSVRQFEFSVPAASSGFVAYFKRVWTVGGYEVMTISGDATNGTNPTNQTDVTHSTAQFRQPLGLAVWTDNGTIQGFFVSNNDQHRITFLNVSGSAINVGGNSVATGQVGLVIGDGTAQYIDAIGISSRINLPVGLTLSHDADTSNTDYLYWADFTNYRIRRLEITDPSATTERFLGSGKTRTGAPTGQKFANEAEFNSPTYLKVDPYDNARKMFVSDASNGRILEIDMLRGLVTPVLGNGTAGDVTTPNQSPSNVGIRGARGIAVYKNTTTNNKYVIYADNEVTAGTNRACMLRAWNYSGASASPWGLLSAIDPDAVTTIAGNYSLGCNTAATAPANANGSSALDYRFHNPEGIEVDSAGNIYVANSNQHCIVKISTAGIATVVAGTCDTANAQNATPTSSLMRFPRSVTIDPLYAADGNLFIVDQADSTSGYVRYLNFKTQALTIFSPTPNNIAASAGGGVGMLSNFTPVGSNANSSRFNDIAAFGNWVCFSSGDATLPDSSNHNVTCWDRTSDGTVMRLFGPQSSAAADAPRAGGPMGPENELASDGVTLINSSAGRLFTPYGLAFDTDGNLYVADRNNHVIRLLRRWFP